MLRWLHKQKEIKGTPNTSSIQQIGKGKIGPKAQNLFDDKKRITKAGITFPSIIPIASDIFQEACDASGASNAKNEREAYRRLYKYALPPSLISNISDSVYSFGALKYSGMATMVRADDWPTGLGLTDSEAAATSREQIENGPKNLHISRVITRLKRVWASCLSENFRIFAEMKGLTDIGAALLMPVYGQPMISKQTGAQDVIFTPMSINFLGFFGAPSTAIFSVGAGLGGANKAHVSTRFRKNEITKGQLVHVLEHAAVASEINRDEGPLALSMSLSRLVPSGLTVEAKIMRVFVDSFFDKSDGYLKQMNAMIAAYSSGRQIYSEFAVPTFESPDIVMLQTAEVARQPAKKPDICGKSIVLESSNVVGSSFVLTKKARFAGGVPTEDDIKFNKENKGYLLVLDVFGSTNALRWELKHLYNAAAIVVCVSDAQGGIGINFEFSTHLGGYFRELGILALGIDGKAADDFRKKLKPDSDCLVFADEFSSDGKSKGLVALI